MHRLRDLIRDVAHSLAQMPTAVAEYSALARPNPDLSEELSIRAMRAPLTGLCNRRFMDQWAAGEWSRTGRASTSFGVILVDIDRFKKVNDEHGHEMGDQVLKAVAAVLRSALAARSHRVPVRREEFVLLPSFIDRDTLAVRALPPARRLH